MQNTIYIKPHYQDTESKQLYLTHKNKQREAAKLRRQRNGAQVKEENKTPAKELSNEEIANLPDTELKTLVIRMLTEMVEYGHKKEEEVKAMQSEIKENVQGRYSDKKETRTQINNLDQQEEINI